MSQPENIPPRAGTWLRAILQLGDGARVELRLPGAVAVSAASYQPEPDEAPSITLTTPTGARRRGRLGQLFADPRE